MMKEGAMSMPNPKHQQALESAKYRKKEVERRFTQVKRELEEATQELELYEDVVKVEQARQMKMSELTVARPGVWTEVPGFKHAAVDTIPAPHVVNGIAFRPAVPLPWPQGAEYTTMALATTLTWWTAQDTMMVQDGELRPVSARVLYELCHALAEGGAIKTKLYGNDGAKIPFGGREGLAIGTLYTVYANAPERLRHDVFRDAAALWRSENRRGFPKVDQFEAALRRCGGAAWLRDEAAK